MLVTTAAISCVSTGATDSVAKLLVGVRDGDSKAWEEIMRRYDKLVSTTVRSFRLQDADALDAVQMTWLRLAENAHRVNFPEKLGGWLATTARRECLRILRQAKLIQNHIEVGAETVVDASAGPEQTVIDADAARTLRKLVAELSPRRRTVLRALFASHNSVPYAEIARSTGIPAGAIGPTRTRALQQLRDKLNDHEMGRDRIHKGKNRIFAIRQTDKANPTYRRTVTNRAFETLRAARRVN